MKNSFSINIVFLVLAIVGAAMLPLLSVQLYPAKEGNALFVSYRWGEVSAEIIEKEVTSPMEGALSAISGLDEISSSSSKGYGQITLLFKKGTDMDAVRFEVGSIIRYLYNKLPVGVSRPQVSGNETQNDDDKLLISYTLNGEGSSLSLQQYAQEHLLPSIALINKVSRVEATGATPMEWEVAYKPQQLSTLGLSQDDLTHAVSNHLSKKELGGAPLVEQGDTSFLYLSFLGQPSDSLSWEAILLPSKSGRIIRLTDVATIRLKEQTPRSFFRINGLNTIYLNIYTAPGANQIQVADNIYQTVNELKRGFPPNFSLLINHDTSLQLREETQKIVFRSGLAILILLLFVLLVSRSFRYLAIIGISLMVNLLIAVIFYYLFHIEIHLYSLAGITVSLGIIIDNTIIMADHLRYHRNMNVFVAILAATLTTMGALVIIFFLKEEQRVNLVDFAMVMMVNLGVSLFVALFFIPSLLDKIKIPINRGQRYFRRKRRVVHFTKVYSVFIGFSHQYKWVFIAVAVWGFGVPVFLLPDKWESPKREEHEPEWYQHWYNASLGNSMYVSEVKPWVNKILGGSLYYFKNYMANSAINWDEQRTHLYVNVSMPDGATLQQMNNVFLELENFLAGFPEIDRFVSRVTGIERSSLTISFTKEAENSSFPYFLKQQMETKATEIDGADFSIYGVGQGFSNALGDGFHNSRIGLYGYNFEELMGHARYLREELLKHARIKEVIIRTDNGWWGKPRFEYVLMASPEALAMNASSIGHLYGQLSVLSQTDHLAGYATLDKTMVPIVLRPSTNEDAGVWNLNNASISQKNGGLLRLKDVGEVVKERVDGSVNKRNQQYQITVTYDFIGPWELARRVLNEKVEMMNHYLPLGFSAQSDSGGWWNREEAQQYWLLLIVMGIIFFICAILLESLIQPLAVIATIPLSFIGVFLTFAFFELPFNQGGYASMVLLCGLTVNSALYIINDYNNNNRRQLNRSKRANYLTAFNHKIIPILLTILSTTLGLIPFLLGGQKEGFWFSLAVGAIGGLVFSVLAIVVWLPVFFRLQNSKL
jgi:multidrug efflux pump subunit AcrB